jgi:membrane protease YdiL (CAAX protease family)
MENSSVTAVSARRNSVAAALAAVVVILALAAVVVPAISPAEAVTGDATIKLLFLGRMVVLLIVATLLLRLRGLRWADVGLRRPRWWRFALAIPGGFALAVIGVTALSAVLATQGIPKADYAMFRPLKGDLPLYLFWLGPVAWGSAAFGEEMIFRGFVTNALGRVFGGAKAMATLGAIIVQAGLFGALHLYLGVGGAASAAMIGLVMGLVWWASGRNLWAAIVLHGLIDSFTITAMYLGASPG